MTLKRLGLPAALALALCGAGQQRAPLTLRPGVIPAIGVHSAALMRSIEAGDRPDLALSRVSAGVTPGTVEAEALGRLASALQDPGSAAGQAALDSPEFLQLLRHVENRADALQIKAAAKTLLNDPAWGFDKALGLPAEGAPAVQGSFSSPAPLAEAIPKGLNFVELERAEQVVAIADRELAPYHLRLAVAGYSSDRDPDYNARVGALLNGINDASGRTTPWVTSPTAGGIDSVATESAFVHGAGILYVTARKYAKWVEPEELPKTVDREAFKKKAKHLFVDNDQYSLATSLAANGLIVMGGGGVTVANFADAIRKGNRIALIDDPKLPAFKWNKPGEPSNGSKYLIDQLKAFLAGKDLPHDELPARGFTKAFLRQNRDRIEALVKTIPLEAGPAAVLSHLRAESRTVIGVDKGNLTLNGKPYDGFDNAVFRELLPALQHDARMTRIMTAKNWNDRTFPIVLRELIQNALDSIQGARRKGTITVESVIRDGKFLAVISDDGPGFQGKIGELLKGGASTKGRGRGYGTTLSKELVEELLGGKFAAENRPEGGARIRLEIPL